MPGAYKISLNSVKLTVGDEVLCSSMQIIPLMTRPGIQTVFVPCISLVLLLL